MPLDHSKTNNNNNNKSQSFLLVPFTSSSSSMSRSSSFSSLPGKRSSSKNKNKKQQHRPDDQTNSPRQEQEQQQQQQHYHHQVLRKSHSLSSLPLPQRPSSRERNNFNPQNSSSSSSCIACQKCVQDCAAYDQVCPWAAHVAAQSATMALQRLLEHSQVFMNISSSSPNTSSHHSSNSSSLHHNSRPLCPPPVVRPVLPSWIVQVGELLGEGGFSHVHVCTVEWPSTSSQPNPNELLKNADNKYSNDAPPASSSQPKQQQNQSSSHQPQQNGRQELALKFLKRSAMLEFSQFKHGAADLAVEAYFLATLQHPHIIKLHGMAAGSVPANILRGSSSYQPTDGLYLLLDRLYQTLEQKIQGWRRQEDELDAEAEQQQQQRQMDQESNGSDRDMVNSGPEQATTDMNTSNENSDPSTPPPSFQSAIWLDYYRQYESQNNPSSTIVYEQQQQRRRHALLERLQIAVQIALALEYLHSKNIMFRDLKPENIGFDQDGVLKLFDFGLAKELKSLSSSTTSTTSSHFQLTGHTGSRRYMAPEVAQGSRHYDLTVDVYSFGILLWELCSATKPFYGYSTQKHLQRVVIQGERPPLNTELWPIALQTLLKQCWSSSPWQRPSFSQIVAILERTARGGNFNPDHYYQWARQSSPEEINLLLGLQQPRHYQNHHHHSLPHSHSRSSSSSRRMPSQAHPQQYSPLQQHHMLNEETDDGAESEVTSTTASTRRRRQKQQEQRQQRRNWSWPRWWLSLVGPSSSSSWSTASVNSATVVPTRRQQERGRTRNRRGTSSGGSVHYGDYDYEDDDITFKSGRRRPQQQQHHRPGSFRSLDHIGTGRKKFQNRSNSNNSSRRQRRRAKSVDDACSMRSGHSSRRNSWRSSLQGGLWRLQRHFRPTNTAAQAEQQQHRQAEDPTTSSLLGLGNGVIASEVTVPPIPMSMMRMAGSSASSSSSAPGTMVQILTVPPKRKQPTRRQQHPHYHHNRHYNQHHLRGHNNAQAARSGPIVLPPVATAVPVSATFIPNHLNLPHHHRHDDDRHPQDAAVVVATNLQEHRRYANDDDDDDSGETWLPSSFHSTCRGSDMEWQAAAAAAAASVFSATWWSSFGGGSWLRQERQESSVVQSWLATILVAILAIWAVTLLGQAATAEQQKQQQQQALLRVYGF